MTIELPLDLHRRAVAIKKAFHVSLNQLARDGIDARVTELEERRRRDEAEKISAKAAAKEKRAGRGIRPLEPVAPVDTVDAPIRVVGGDRRLSVVYEEHARRILAAGEDEAEMRRRVEAAIKAVRLAAPLTAPPDKVIVTRLEAVVLELREAAPVEETRNYDASVDRVIDVARVQTRGAVVPPSVAPPSLPR